MAAPTGPKKATAPGTRARKATKKPVVRKRAVKKKIADAQHVPPHEQSHNSGKEPVRYSSTGNVEHLALLSAALLFGLFGFALHFLWFVSIILMALLMGLLAADMRRNREGGVISEVVDEARNVVEAISNDNSPGAASEAEHDEDGDERGPEESRGIGDQ